ncbi:autotransporter domain-containing protein [Sphingobacterium chuzhouense]|uniref:Outer membrane beta-barrel protein n=1 Tax=Sphingobacterium chuzhouense TaxID=1742264 RepID=A0ABR7XR89_9SPHI|nr:autotransporter domain-containing protein [Sphingobacterium chuzhouense]MBD1421658.1 outer membrane beta-barrel protein [Sphingobacterium chuzhouense]
MKKFTIILVALMSFVAIVKAQEFNFKKGNFLVEGTLSASVQEGGMENYDKRSAFGFQPQASYFLTDKLALGLSFGIGNGKFEESIDATEGTIDYNHYSAGVFGRYYFLDLGTRFKTFTSLEGHFMDMSYNDDIFDLPNTKQYAIRGGIGMNFFITRNVAINYTFSNVVGFSSLKSGENSTTNSFSLSLNDFQNFFNSGSFSLSFRF